MNALPNEITEVITGTAQGRLPVTAWARPLSNVPDSAPPCGRRIESEQERFMGQRLRYARAWRVGWQARAGTAEWAAL